MEKFIHELVECRMQLLRDKHGQHLVFNHLSLHYLVGNYPIYVGYKDATGQVWDDLLSNFKDPDFAEEVYELIAKLYPSLPQYEL